jgi:hypothetical protein
MIKPRFKFLIFITIQFVACKTFASQFHFVSATVRFRSGDSTKGLVDEYGLLIKPNRIRFKSVKDDPESIFYTGAEVKEFELKDNLFEGYIGDVDSAHLFVVPKDTVINPRKIRDTLFLKPLVKGATELFSGIDKNGMIHFFFRKNNDSLTELHYYSVQWSQKGTDVGIVQKMSYYKIEKDDYKQQMLAAFSDNKTIYEELAVAHVHYNKSAFIKWFSLYNSQNPIANRN